MTNQFDTAIYPTLAAAWGNANILDPILPLNSTLYFTCDPTSFVRVAGGWWNTVTQQYYSLPGAANEGDICGPGVKTRLAESRQQPRHFIMILCPLVLEQVDGQPKLYADLSGTELSHNTRLNEEYDPPLTNAMTLNILLWIGMSIDQLRERVLSVYIGRAILLVISAKYLESQGLIGKAWLLPVIVDIANLVSNTVTSSPSRQDFAGSVTLPVARAVQNVDSLSMYMTGE